MLVEEVKFKNLSIHKRYEIKLIIILHKAGEGGSGAGAGANAGELIIKKQ